MPRKLPTKVTITSRLTADPESVWAAVTDLDQVNREMSPLLRMTPPVGMAFADAAVGEVLELKLSGPFGAPLGTYPLRLVNIDLGRGFLEQTQMLPFLLWQHERTLSADPDGTLITDALGWSWRARRLDPIVTAGVRRFFTLRHRQLRREFD